MTRRRLMRRRARGRRWMRTRPFAISRPWCNSVFPALLTYGRFNYTTPQVAGPRVDDWRCLDAPPPSRHKQGLRLAAGCRGEGARDALGLRLL
eukprot:5201513-Pyramimonas_sp.AAC.1